MEPTVRAELESLLQYARGLRTVALERPDQPDILDGGTGYLGGALTTLLHVCLLTEEEHREWWDRVMGELPPTPSVGS